MSIITIDLRKRQLIWEQIVDSVKDGIAGGYLKENDYMPSVRALAGELGINPNTIQKAYAELERQGIIRSVTGKGSIILASAESVSDMNKEKLLAAVEVCARDAVAGGVSYEEFLIAAKKVFDAAGDKK